MMCGAWIRELRLIGVRAEVECRRADGLIATAGRCEEWHLFEKCGSSWRIFGRQSTRGEVPVRPMECGAWTRELDSRAEANWCPCGG